MSNRAHLSSADPANSSSHNLPHAQAPRGQSSRAHLNFSRYISHHEYALPSKKREATSRRASGLRIMNEENGTPEPEDGLAFKKNSTYGSSIG